MASPILYLYMNSLIHIVIFPDRVIILQPGLQLCEPAHLQLRGLQLAGDRAAAARHPARLLLPHPAAGLVAPLHVRTHCHGRRGG